MSDLTGVVGSAERPVCDVRTGTRSSVWGESHDDRC